MRPRRRASCGGSRSRLAPAQSTDAPAEHPVYLAVYRGSDDKVGFLELNAVTAGLLNAIEENEAGLTGEQLLRKLAADIGYSDVDAFVEHGASALGEMRSLEILIGARSAD